jgi:hypothetical protein
VAEGRSAAVSGAAKGSDTAALPAEGRRRGQTARRRARTWAWSASDAEPVGMGAFMARVRRQ